MLVRTYNPHVEYGTDGDSKITWFTLHSWYAVYPLSWHNADKIAIYKKKICENSQPMYVVVYRLRAMHLFREDIFWKKTNIRQVQKCLSTTALSYSHDALSQNWNRIGELKSVTSSAEWLMQGWRNETGSWFQRWSFPFTVDNGASRHTSPLSLVSCKGCTWP